MRGALTVQRTSGLFQGIYHRAINCLVNQGYYISLIVQRQDMTALAIQLQSLPKGVAEGVRFRIDEQRIVFEANHRIVSIELAGAPLWEGKMPGGRANVRALACILKQELSSCGREGGFLTVVGKARDEGSAVAGRNIFYNRAEKILLGASRQLRTSGMLSGLGGLIGLGPGLTPSGDDFLVGLLFGRQLMLLSRKEAMLPINERGIRANHDKTTPAGKSALLMAFQDRFPFYLLEIKKAAETITPLGNRDLHKDLWSEDQDSSLAQAVRSAMHHGETSGTDTLAGLWWYLDLCRRATSMGLPVPEPRDNLSSK